jgi:hypothetical protein
MNDTLAQSGADAKTAAMLAQRALKDAHVKFASDVLDQALGAGSKVANAAETLHNNVVKASSDAYDLLDNASVNIKLQPFLDKADSIASDLEAQGTLESKSQAQRIRQYADSIKEQYTPPIEQAPGYGMQGVAGHQIIQPL